MDPLIPLRRISIVSWDILGLIIYDLGEEGKEKGERYKSNVFFFHFTD